jgi:hypothetical protein
MQLVIRLQHLLGHHNSCHAYAIKAWCAELFLQLRHSAVTAETACTVHNTGLLA